MIITTTRFIYNIYILLTLIYYKLYYNNITIKFIELYSK